MANAKRAQFILDKLRASDGTIIIIDANDKIKYKAVIAEYAEQQAKRTQQASSETKNTGPFSGRITKHIGSGPPVPWQLVPEIKQ